MSASAEIARLNAYYPFDTSIVEDVADVAEAHRRSNWDDVQKMLPEPDTFIPASGHAIEVLDIIPPAGYDNTYVYHLPMGNGLDANMVTRMAVLSDVLPAARIIAVGNPTGPGKPTGKIPVGELPTVWQGDLYAAVKPTLEYIDTQGLGEVSHVGYSYGADRAAAAAHRSGAHDQRVLHGIFMEPAAVQKRSLLGLGVAFNSSAAALPGYVQAVDSHTYDRAREHASQTGHGLTGYTLGLMRLSNLAIAHALTRDTFPESVRGALNVQVDMHASVIWGTDSEVAPHQAMQGIVDQLQESSPGHVHPLVMEGQRHAMGDDIFLHAALVAQSIRAAK
jgi:pimeloyl-ACP methyl ester carboxylesterase